MNIKAICKLCRGPIEGVPEAVLKVLSANGMKRVVALEHAGCLAKAQEEHGTKTVVIGVKPDAPKS